jgi:uncharacterized membrane protein YkvA (DUF1232 family)
MSRKGSTQIEQVLLESMGSSTAHLGLCEERRSPLDRKSAAPYGSCLSVMPIDLIPDLIPVIGLADDAGVIALAFNKLRDKLADFSNGTIKDIEPSFLTKACSKGKGLSRKIKNETFERPVT